MPTDARVLEEGKQGAAPVVPQREWALPELTATIADHGLVQVFSTIGPSGGTLSTGCFTKLKACPPRHNGRKH
jgi:hypothetical protein